MKTSVRASDTTTRLGSLRRTAALALVACGAAVLIAPAVAGAAEGDDATAKITVVQTPAENQDAPCKNFPDGASYTTDSSAESFVLTVTLDAPLCEPINATAAIYAMKSATEPWPQTLAETKDVILSEAGVTAISFAKDCLPVQFDVINGATPASINWGSDHGPLLFPGDVATAEQYPGYECPPASTTTTTESTTTTTQAPATSSTIPADVLGSTTIAPAAAAVGSSSTTTPQVAAVQAATATRNPSNAAALALTGNSSTTGVVIGLVLLTLGGGLFFASRRRRSAEA